MKQPYRHRVNRREFLNLPGFHEGAYVMAYVEDTSERELERYGSGFENPRPRVMLQIADCERHIELEFGVYSAHQRMNSFHKVQTLIDALEELKAGLAEECALYRCREGERKRSMQEADSAS